MSIVPATISLLLSAALAAQDIGRLRRVARVPVASAPIRGAAIAAHGYNAVIVDAEGCARVFGLRSELRVLAEFPIAGLHDGERLVLVDEVLVVVAAGGEPLRAYRCTSGDSLDLARLPRVRIERARASAGAADLEPVRRAGVDPDDLVLVRVDAAGRRAVGMSADGKAFAFFGDQQVDLGGRHGGAGSPALSADGQFLAFGRPHGLVVVDLRDGSRRVLAEFGSDAVVASGGTGPELVVVDGDRIVFWNARLGRARRERDVPPGIGQIRAARLGPFERSLFVRGVRHTHRIDLDDSTARAITWGSRHLGTRVEPLPGGGWIGVVTEAIDVSSFAGCTLFVETEDGRRRELEFAAEKVAVLDVLPCGTSALVAGVHGCDLVDVERLQVEAEMDSGRPHAAVALGDDLALLLVHDQTLVVSLPSFEIVAQRELDDPDPSSLIRTPDCSRVAIACRDAITVYEFTRR